MAQLSVYCENNTKTDSRCFSYGTKSTAKQKFKVKN